MAKTKAVPQTNGHKIKGDTVKDARVDKPVKDVVKAKTADKLNGSKVGDSKKSSKKAPPPVESSDSESASDDESEGSEASSASDDSENEAETDSKPAAVAKAVVNGAKAVVNGAASKVNGAKPSADESDNSAASEGSDSEGSDESDEEVPVTKATEATKATKAAKPSAAKDDSSDEDESDSEIESPAKSGATPDMKMADGSDSDDEDDASSASSSDDEDDAPKKAAPTPAPAQKRKADAIEDTPAKKVKTEGNINGGTNLFVGSLSWNIDEDWLRREFEHFGTVKGCRVITDRESGRSKGFGYVDFEDPAVAQKAHDEMKGYELDGRAINVDFSQPREKTDASPGGFKQRANDRGNKFGDQLSPPSDTLFVANLSFDTTAESLRERLEQYGDITRISLPTHQDSGQPKGFGYIGFGSVSEAQAALDANKGQMIDGRPVRFDFASARPDNGGGDRGGRGGGRGGGFRGGDRGRGRGGFGDRGRGGRGGGFRGGDRGGRGRGGSTNRGGVGDFSGKKVSF